MGRRMSLEVGFESLKTLSLPIHSPSCLQLRRRALSSLPWPPSPPAAMLFHHNRPFPRESEVKISPSFSKLSWPWYIITEEEK